jgi:hypothetical protein
MAVPVFVSSCETMTNQAITLPDKVTTDLECSEIFRPDRNKGEERDHEAVAITHGVIHSDHSARRWFYLQKRSSAGAFAAPRVWS